MSPGPAAVGDDGIADRRDDEGQVARAQIRGSSLLLGGQVFATLVNLAVQILIVRYLAKSDYGVFAYVLSVVTLTEVVAALGLHRALPRFMPIYEERRDAAKAAGMLLLAVSTVLSVGLALVLVVIGLRGLIAEPIDGGEVVTVLVIMIFLAPLGALGNVLEGVFAVFHMPRAIVIRRHILGPLLRLTVVGLLALTGSGVVFLAWGYLATGLLGIAIFAPLLVPVLRERGLWEHMRPGALTVPVREPLRFAVTLLSTDLGTVALATSGPIVVGLFAGSTEVASLRAVIPVVATMSTVLLTFARLFWPLASRLYVRGDAAELNRLYWSTTSWTTVLVYPIFVTAVVLAEPLTELLFGERYESSAPVLAVLAVGMFANVASGTNGELLGVFGRIRFIAVTSALTVVVTLGLTFLLVPAYDALGAAIAFSITYILLSVVRQTALRRRTTVRAFDRRYAAVWLVAAVATGAALAIELALSPPTPVGIALVAVAYAVVLMSARRQLRILETFPEVARLPGVGALLRRPPGAPPDP
jgi:O-antigen/teichoic acid export membrane protein